MGPLVTGLNNRNINTSIIRLRIGHTRLKNHLFKLGMEDDPNCNCGEEETIEHVILRCPRYFTARVRFKHSLYMLKIPFELTRILGTDDEDPDLKKKIFRHLAVFLKSTGLVDKI